MQVEEQYQKFQQEFDTKKCCVLIPTYNNARELKGVIDAVLEYTSNVIVVNDGCTDETASILTKYDTITIMGWEVNQGKGTALKEGFKKAEELGYDYAITLDSDGQHRATDLPVFLEKLENHPNAIIIGARDMEQGNVPGKSSFGHKFSNFWFTFETGIKAPDTQSGYRLYPLKAVNSIRMISWKYEFEVEILVRSAWMGVEITSVIIDVYYPPTEERISHFRPLQDFTRISILNTVLVTITLLYIKPRDLYRKIKKKNLKDHIYDLFLDTKETPLLKATSVGFGVFMGIVPIWGYQLAAAIGLAHVLKLNKPLVIVAANISIPPFIPLWLYASVKTGEYLLNRKMEIHSLDSITIEAVQEHLSIYLTGATVFAIIMGLGCGILSFGVFYLLQFRNRK